MTEWVDGVMYRRMDGGTDGWTDGWMDERTGVCTDGGMHGRVDGEANGRAIFDLALWRLPIPT